MDEFARLEPDERLAFINEAAARRDLNSIIIEKDFWVCWTLRRLMSVPVLAEHLTFKGGTSLSKAYGIIDRFSEDIDLTIGRSAPKIKEIKPPMENGISGNERERRIKGLKIAAQYYVKEIALPSIRSAISEELHTDEGWDVFLDPEDPAAQTILFQYPKLMSYGTHAGAVGTAPIGVVPLGAIIFIEGYIKPRIKLEFGARGEPEPSEIRTITPYLAQEFSAELQNAQTQISTLSVERTFWEKVTILHALYHGANFRAEMSRHYYDTAMLAAKGVDDLAMKAPDLLERVVLNKSLMFPDKKASYETAVFGTLQLVPNDILRERLRADYGAMAEMFMVAPPKFEDLMESISQLEAKLNR